MGDLPLNNYSHDKAINQAAPLPARLLLLLWGRILDLFAVMLSHLGRTPLARKPHGGAVLSAVGPAEAGIPTQPDGPHVEIRPKCSKDQRDLNVAHRWLLNVNRSMRSVLFSRMRKRHQNPRSINQIILLCSDNDVISEILSI